MIVNYKYVFLDWDEFAKWLISHGFERYEYAMPCRRGYIKQGVDINVSYYTHIPNEIKESGIKFFDPNEISQDVLKSWAV